MAIMGSSRADCASLRALLVAMEAAAVIMGTEVVNFLLNWCSRTSQLITGKLRRLPGTEVKYMNGAYKIIKE